MLSQATFAFLVMTAEEEHADSTVHARPNVIHEVGLFQGRLGFPRAIVLLEEGCSDFSNIIGLSQIRFPSGDIQARFEMLSVLHTAEAHRKARGGKPNPLAVATRLVMTLEYWREYRTSLHIGHSYGVSESTAYRNIRWCEDTLIKSGAFTLPGKKALVTSDRTDEIILIDATETPVERPPKNSVATTRARKNAIR